MSVHFNGKKARELYFNGKKISESYFNGDKVYSFGIPVWRFQYNGSNLYLIGEYSTNGLLSFFDITSAPTITDISGIIGNPSSYIWTTNGNINTPYSFTTLKVVAGNSYFLYFSNTGMLGDGQWVLSDYSVRDKSIPNFGNTVAQITSITDNEIVFNINGISFTAQRDINYFGILTKQGVIQQ